VEGDDLDDRVARLVKISTAKRLVALGDLEVSPDLGMYEVCCSRHLTPRGSGLSSTEPPGRNCPAHPRSQGTDPSNLGRAGVRKPRRGHFESGVRSVVGHEHKTTAR
jgi:hypothetical protein